MVRYARIAMGRKLGSTAAIGIWIAVGALSVVAVLWGPKWLMSIHWKEPVSVREIADVPEVGKSLESFRARDVQYILGRSHRGRTYFIFGHVTPEDMEAFSNSKGVRVEKFSSPKAFASTPPMSPVNGPGDPWEYQWRMLGGVSNESSVGSVFRLFFSPTTEEFVIKYYVTGTSD
jgi:hypothetical protein